MEGQLGLRMIFEPVPEESSDRTSSRFGMKRHGEFHFRQSET